MFVLDRGAGVPVVLLHGFGLDHRSLLPLDPVLERSGGWRRVYVDLPIDAVGSTPELAGTLVAEVADRLDGEPFAVLGNSYGGMLARHLAHALRPQALGLATLAGVFVARHADRDVPPRTVLREDPGVEPLLADALAGYRELAVVESTGSARAFLDHEWPALRDVDQAALDRVAAHYALEAEPKTPTPIRSPGRRCTWPHDRTTSSGTPTRGAGWSTTRARRSPSSTRPATTS